MTVARYLRGLRHQEAGFLLVEVLIAGVILVVGALGTVVLLDVANRQTSTADSRGAGTAIAREVLEAARNVPAASLTSSNVVASLEAAAPGLPDAVPADPAWTVVRRGVTFGISVSLCSVDDPADGVGSITDGTGCASNPTGTADARPVDARRVTVTVAPSGGGTRAQVRQTAELPIGAGDDLPAVSQLAMTSPSSCSANCPQVTSQAITSVAFSATAVNSTSAMSWLVNGVPAASCPPTTAACSGSGASWAFTWDIGAVVKDTNSSSWGYGMCAAGSYTLDGQYTVGARPSDATGLTGSDASLTVVLNRCAPLPPPDFNATGRDATLSYVDTEWNGNDEGDVVGYRVYRGTSSGSRTLVCPTSGSYIPIHSGLYTCVDPSPPPYDSKSSYYYSVYAVDTDASGAAREGAPSYLDVNTGDRAPNVPGSFAAASGGVLTWTLPSDPDSNKGDSVTAFRIYRASTGAGSSPTLGDRLDYESAGMLCSGSNCTWTDRATGGTTHKYWVTAVDEHLRESAPTTGKTG